MEKSPAATGADGTSRSPIDQRLTALIAAGMALGIYLLTLAPDLTWRHFGGDGGELITAAATLGVPHPSGYPTYVLLGNVVYHLPIEPPVLRFHLFSALSTAMAAGTVTAAGTILLRPRTRAGAVAPLTAGLACALAPLIWSQALIAEVYALNLAVVGLLVYAVASRRPLWLRGFLFGLSLTTHLTSALLLPLLLVGVPWRRWWRMLPAALVGLLPYAVLPLLARSGSPVLWGEPTTAAGWWWLVSGTLYRPNLFGLSAVEMGRRVAEWAPRAPGTIHLPGPASGGPGRVAGRARAPAATAGRRRHRLFLSLLRPGLRHRGRHHLHAARLFAA